LIYQIIFFFDLYDKCLDENCPFLPMCYTGCRFDSLIKNGSFERIDCKKKALEEINTKILNLNYQTDLSVR